MSVDYKVRQIYNEVIGEVTKTQEAWKSVLYLAGQIYRYEFDNILMVYAQKPHATLVADFDTWKQVGRYVKRGSKGIAIYPSKALKPYMRYVFDISDTGGKEVELTWNLTGDKMSEFMEYQISHGRYNPGNGETENDVKKALKDFTKNEIRGIIKEEFEERMSSLLAETEGEISQITGSVIKERNEKREGLQDMTELAEIARKGILYVVGTRCGFDLSAEEQDFSQIVKITDEDIIYRLGSLICDVSCNVLRAFSKDCKAIESERRIAYGNRVRVQGSRRDFVSGIGDSKREGELGETREIWSSGDEVFRGDGAGTIQKSVENRQDDREDVSGGGRSESDDGAASTRLLKEKQTTESKQYHGNVEVARAGEDDGGRNRLSGNRDEVSLNAGNNTDYIANDTDEELNRELDEINSLGIGKEAGEYVQVSFFFDGTSTQIQYGSSKPQPQSNSYMEKFQEEMEEAKSGKYNYLTKTSHTNTVC